MENFDPDWQPKRSKVPVVIAVLLLVAMAVGAYFLFFVKRPRADRILVLITTERADGTVEAWWDGEAKASKQLTEGLNKLLEAHGMQVIDVDDPKVLELLKGKKSLDELREAARELEAGFVLVGTIKTVASVFILGARWPLVASIWCLRLEASPPCGRYRQS